MSAERTTVGGFVSIAKAFSMRNPELPRAGQSPARFGDFSFETGPRPADRPGVFILTENVNGFTWPLYIGEAESVASAVEALGRENAELARHAKGCAWLPTPLASLRGEVARKLIDIYNPPFNVPKPATHRGAPPFTTLGRVANGASSPAELSAAAIAREMKELVARY